MKPRVPKSQPCWTGLHDLQDYLNGRSEPNVSTVEAACYSTPEESGLRVETLPFENVPHQSRLFLDYLKIESRCDVFILQPFASITSWRNAYRKSSPRIKSIEARFAMSRAMNQRWGAARQRWRTSGCFASQTASRLFQVSRRVFLLVHSTQSTKR